MQRDNLFQFLSANWKPGVLAISDGDVAVTYADLQQNTARMAHYLLGIGLKPQDRVVVQAEKSLGYLVLYLACLRAGLVFVPLNPAYTMEEFTYFLGDADPALVVVDPARLPVASAMTNARLMGMDQQGLGDFSGLMRNYPADFTDYQPSADDLACLLYTSGTTGKPKAAMITHGNLISQAGMLVDYWQISADDCLLHALPIFHIHGLFVALHIALRAGARIVWMVKFDAAMVLEKLPGCSLFMGVPTYYSRLIQDEAAFATAARDLRLMISGSAPLAAELWQRIKDVTNHAVLERYGMTETGMICSNPLLGERRPGYVGKPLPGVALRLAEGAEIGEIEVRAPGLCRGYWRRDPMVDRTADGFFKTGDIGRLAADGYVELVGRAKDLIISGGLNIYPNEIEQVIAQLSDIEDSAVFGVPHPDFGEAVVAAIVTKSDSELDVAKMAAELRDKLANFKQPKHIVQLSELPRNAMGKVQKNALRDVFHDLFKTA